MIEEASFLFQRNIKCQLIDLQSTKQKEAESFYKSFQLPLLSADDIKEKKSKFIHKKDFSKDLNDNLKMYNLIMDSLNVSSIVHKPPLYPLNKQKQQKADASKQDMFKIDHSSLKVFSFCDRNSESFNTELIMSSNFDIKMVKLFNILNNLIFFYSF